MDGYGENTRLKSSFFACACGFAAFFCNTDVLAQDAAARIAQLEQQIRILEERVHQLEGSAPDTLQKHDAQIDTVNRTSGTATTEFGAFVVEPLSVIKTGGGWRVTLAVGNATAVRFRGAEIYLEWGPAIPEDATTRDFTRAQSRTVKVSQQLVSGAYTRMSFLLAADSRADLRNMHLGVRPLSPLLHEPPN